MDKLVTTLGMLVIVMTIAGVFREANVMGGLYSFLKKGVKSKRGLVAVLSLCFGVLPIPGRIIFACGILDSLQDKERNNQKMGTIAYLAAHHYYLWSPLEKSVIITSGILSVSYLTFMSYMWIPALLMILFSLVYIFAAVAEDEIHLIEPKDEDWHKPVTYVGLMVLAVVTTIAVPSVSISVLAGYALGICLVEHKFSWSWYDEKVLVMATAATLAGMYIGSYSGWLTSLIPLKTTLVVTASAAFVFAFITGSSAKFAAICGLIVKIVGIKYLPLIYLVEFAGYLISPAHNCVAIAKTYFKTPVGMFFLPLILLSLMLIAYGTAVVFL